jgi:putative RNase toxin 15 of polymorphic toxin system
VTLTNAFTAKEKPAAGKKLASTRAEMRRQVGIQEAALNGLTVSQWRANWEKFYGPADDDSEAQGRADESQAARDREAAINAERAKVLAQWRKDNPGKSMDDAEAFVEELFTRNPGDKSYPFKYKSRDSNGKTYENPVYGKTILHAADQAAGGGSATAGLGGARENFSIGAQWDRGGRAKELKTLLDAAIAKAAAKMTSDEVDKLHLNVKLPVIDG